MVWDQVTDCPEPNLDSSTYILIRSVFGDNLVSDPVLLYNEAELYPNLMAEPSKSTV